MVISVFFTDYETKIIDAMVDYYNAHGKAANRENIIKACVLKVWDDSNGINKEHKEDHYES